MSSTRTASNRMLVIGLAVLAVGVVLVLLILRNGLGAEPAAGDAGQAEASAADASGDAAQAQTQAQTVATQTTEDLAHGRLPLPLEIPEGSEALAVRAGFVRGVAGLPRPGDRVNLYRSSQARTDDAQDPVAGSRLPSPGPAGELALAEVEVLGLIGPLPSENEGEFTVLLAVDSGDVPGLLPLARDGELWLTLLPAAEE